MVFLAGIFISLGVVLWFCHYIEHAPPKKNRKPFKPQHKPQHDQDDWLD